MKALLGTSEDSWRRFAHGWHGMPIDPYMADGGRYRRRRYGVFEVGLHSFEPICAQPHYQSLAHNHLNGGVERWFAGLSNRVTGSPVLARILECCREAYQPLAPTARRWRAEVHQFRIEATALELGLPTPEGRHRDGVTGGLALLVSRERVTGGVTRLWTSERDDVTSLEMRVPGEALFFDDRRLLHQVSPVHVAAGAAIGHRDVLVVTFDPVG